MPELVGLVLLLAVTAYSTAGGVDFGAGIWDLLAGTSARGKDARALIDHAMAPVWEVNNVWLVLAIVACWTGFPPLFEAVFLSLYPLFTVALIGLVLRGAFFAFRHIADDPRSSRAADIVFGVSSVLTPFCFAASLGAIASGRVGAAGAFEASFNPTSISFGLVSVAATAFSGAAFLVGDARRYGRAELAGYFQTRVVAAGIALIATGTLALGVIATQDPALLKGMVTGLGLPFALATMVLVPAVMLMAWRGVLRWYRVMTVVAVGSMVFAWAFAQSPYLLPGKLTIAQAVAPPATQAVLAAITVALVVLVVPSMALLYYLDQKNTLESPE